MENKSEFKHTIPEERIGYIMRPNAEVMEQVNYKNHLPPLKSIVFWSWRWGDLEPDEITVCIWRKKQKQ